MNDSMAGAVDLTELATGGVRLGVRVKPGGRTNRLVGSHAGGLKVEITAAPERGKANEAVVKLLADLLDVRRSDVTIVSGLGSRNKTVVLNGATIQQIAGRLRGAGIQVIQDSRFKIGD